MVSIFCDAIRLDHRMAQRVFVDISIALTDEVTREGNSPARCALQ
jgi:hypothetical protein